MVFSKYYHEQIIVVALGERKRDEGSRNGCAATAGLSIKKQSNQRPEVRGQTAEDGSQRDRRQMMAGG